ncbi:MAG: hypothetical protein J07HQW1_00337 [Haloquadratum walsbyi J07HQW1]|jgi:endonuclease YncB( thermonuclease family)|uniref:Uncharacterized protein n=2 Tax=Haloquadratum walsbyi J07HQW1 TaxID=1238424 RepID=U1N1U8_9EURY|nr:MAG: hypothetical protein J07HQW1_00337 [Haloquadratum walsbyi J07HQW1]
MQRRAAAVYAALFIIIGAGAYSLIATAETPHVTFEDPTYELGSGDQFEVNGQTYTVSSISTSEQGGGHGGTATTVTKGAIQYTNDSAQYTVSFENNSTQTVDQQQWRVLVDRSGDNPTQLTFRESINETAILAADPNVSTETVTQNNDRYVVRNNNQLVPVAEYFPEPETRSYAEGDTLEYQGNTTTVETVTNESVQLVWTAPRTNTIEVSHNDNITIGDDTYLAHFPHNSTLQLTQNFERYQQQKAAIEQYQTQKNGLWGVSIASGLTVVFLIGFAYLPSRY